jgi:hypothetical protein
MSDIRLQQFFDYKAIIELKARFGRLADVKDWEGFAGVFTEDATFDLGDGNVLVGGRSYAYAIRDMLEGARSLHRFLMPEISLISDTEASGIWMLNDYVEWGPDPVTGARSGFKGYGREYESYRKIDLDWKIASWRVRYDRMDPLPEEALPAKVTGGPDALRDAAYLTAAINPLGS